MLSFYPDDDENYSDYSRDYEHLGNLWDDFKVAVTGIFNAAVGIATPVVHQVAPPLLYHGVTGHNMPIQQAANGQQPPVVVVQQAGLPSWVLPAAAGIAAVFLILKMKKA